MSFTVVAGDGVVLVIGATANATGGGAGAGRGTGFACGRATIGRSIDDAALRLRPTVIVGLPSAGIRANVSLSAPAMATRIRSPAASSTEMGCRPKSSRVACPGTSGDASARVNEWNGANVLNGGAPVEIARCSARSVPSVRYVTRPDGSTASRYTKNAPSAAVDATDRCTIG